MHFVACTDHNETVQSELILNKVNLHEKESH